MIDNRIRKKSYDKRKREMLSDRDDRSHGTMTGYKYGCRCFKCRMANHNDYARRHGCYEPE